MLDATVMYLECHKIPEMPRLGHVMYRVFISLTFCVKFQKPSLDDISENFLADVGFFSLLSYVELNADWCQIWYIVLYVYTRFKVLYIRLYEYILLIYTYVIYVILIYYLY